MRQVQLGSDGTAGYPLHRAARRLPHRQKAWQRRGRAGQCYEGSPAIVCLGVVLSVLPPHPARLGRRAGRWQGGRSACAAVHSALWLLEMLRTVVTNVAPAGGLCTTPPRPYHVTLLPAHSQILNGCQLKIRHSARAMGVRTTTKECGVKCQ